MTLLSKEQILKAKDRKYRDVEVKSWGGKVRIQAMSGEARDALDEMLYASGKGARLKNFRATYLSFCIVDAKGDLVFSEDDVVELGKKNTADLERLFIEAQELNGLTQEAVEEAEKN